MLAQRRLAACRAGFENDTGQDLLAVHRICDADCCTFEHGRMCQQCFVDLARGDVLSALDDQLLQAPGDEVAAVSVAVAQRSTACAVASGAL